VPPSVKTLADHSYPLVKDIRFVTRGGDPAAVSGIVEFAFSSQGRAIAEQAGVLVTAEGPAGR
jgi:phosphate transport system substrate-binding protein